MGLRVGIHSGPPNASGFDEYLSIWRLAKRTLRIVAEHATGGNTFHGDPAEYRHGVEDFLISARPPADRRTIELFARVVGPAVREG